ncbi:MAG TPA: glycosyltransferase [Gemmatimonadales bacterium]|nr:glycosyltransferase [Gemmatimonadales bacterium]
MTAFDGLRVILAAAFNTRYHRSGLALASALESLGCEVRRCELRERGLARILRRPLPRRLGAMLRRPVDLVLVFKGSNLSRDVVAQLRRQSRARWACWFPDDPHEIDVSLKISPAYDWFFTHDSSSLDRHRGSGAKAYYLAFGCDPAYLTPPLLPNANGHAPLGFVGSRDPIRERALSDIRDLGLETWGPGWPAGAVYGRKFVAALAGAVVGINMHQQFGSADPDRYGTGANMRVFELAAVGTPQLCDAKADIRRHFTPDREIVLYRSVAELRERARALLDDESLRRSLATRARERALREHTWAIRLAELLDVSLR